MTVSQTLTYINNYGDHFSIRQYIHLNTKVIGIRRNSSDTRWVVTFRTLRGEDGDQSVEEDEDDDHGEKENDYEKEEWREDIKRVVEKREFDKIIVCTGENYEAYVPVVEGRERFKGVVIHSQAFKRSV